MMNHNEENTSSLQAVLDGLAQIKKRENAEGTASASETVSVETVAVETVADDFELEESQLQNIRQTEETVRTVLELFGVDYDALVRMDGKSTYSRAVGANPAVLQQVKASANPVVEALKVAVAYKPYAEFAEKYGETPEAIKAAMKKEVETEMKQKAPVKETVKEDVGSAFSQISRGTSPKKVRSGEQSLKEIFGK